MPPRDSAYYQTEEKGLDGHVLAKVLNGTAIAWFTTDVAVLRCFVVPPVPASHQDGLGNA